MTKDIRDYLPLYMGCECVLTKSDGGFDTPAVGTKLTLNSTLLMRCFEPKDSTLEVKLLLRPLENMTEQEAIECAGLSEWPPHFEKPKAERTKFNDWIVTWNDGHEKQNVTGDLFWCPEQFQWLLSKRFDLFELIYYKLAIDKTK